MTDGRYCEDLLQNKAWLLMCVVLNGTRNSTSLHSEPVVRILLHLDPVGHLIFNSNGLIRSHFEVHLSIKLHSITLYNNHVKKYYEDMTCNF